MIFYAKNENIFTSLGKCFKPLTFSTVVRFYRGKLEDDLFYEVVFSLYPVNIRLCLPKNTSVNHGLF